MSFDLGRSTGVGIGAVLSPSKGRVRFLSLDPACGAYQAGIRRHELLESIVVEGREQFIEDVAQAAALVKGAPGTSLKMVIRCASSDVMIPNCIPEV
jgi:hypothetical protein